VKHLLLLAPIALVAACSGPKSTETPGPQPLEPAAPAPAEPAPVEPAPVAPADEPAAPEPSTDSVVGTWVFDPATSWADNEATVMSFIEPMLEDAPPEMVESARAEAQAGFEQQQVELTLEEDGSVSSRFRESTEEEWFAAVGDWVVDGAGVVTVTTYPTDENGAADLEAEPEVQVVSVTGDVMTVEVDAGFSALTMTFLRQ